ncbi:MAG: extracellular solute-binding protein, partial [Chloroflexota bacterium]
VSYASSPPAEVYFAEATEDRTTSKTAPTASITADGMCFRQIEFAGVLNGAHNPEAAQQFIDFLLSTDFQDDMPLQMFVFPVSSDAQLPDVFTEYAAIPEHPVDVTIDEIDAEREQWIQSWTETVLR